MRRRRGRNPRSGRKRRRKTQVWSDGEVTVDTDSDFCISDSEDEVDEPLPPLVVQVPDSPTHRRRSSGRRRREGSPPLVWEIWEKENKRWIDEFEKKKVVEADEQSIAEAVEPSSDIVLPLLRFQKEWLFWALKQEESEVRGGVLADEMGMGKTIQAISLVLTARNVRSSITDIQTHDMPSCSSLTKTKCTLVICPVVAVIQWVGEIERHTEKGSAHVLVYHGPKRSNAAYDFNRYDFVITTYSTIECDYRKYIMPPKERCKFCDRMFYPKKMRVHLKYYCGPHARRTEKQSKQEKKMKQVKGKEFDVEEGCLSDVEKEKGQGAKKGGRKANKRQDESTVNPGVLDKGKSILHSVKWERIILDEVIFSCSHVCLNYV